MICEKLEREAYLAPRSPRPPVPAYFNDAQRPATKDAQIAGLEVLRISSTSPPRRPWPTDWTRTRKTKRSPCTTWEVETRFVVLELGDSFEVKSTNGDTHLGGDDFDQRIIQWLIEQEVWNSGVDLKSDRMALRAEFKEAAEKAKINLHYPGNRSRPCFITADALGPRASQREAFPAPNSNIGGRGHGGVDPGTCPQSPEGCRDDGGRDPRGSSSWEGSEPALPLVVKTVKDFLQEEQGVNP